MNENYFYGFMHAGAGASDAYYYWSRGKVGAGVDSWIALRGIFKDVLLANGPDQPDAKYRDKSVRDEGYAFLLYAPHLFGDYLVRLDAVPKAELCIHVAKCLRTPEGDVGLGSVCKPLDSPISFSVDLDKFLCPCQITWKGNVVQNGFQLMCPVWLVQLERDGNLNMQINTMLSLLQWRRQRCQTFPRKNGDDGQENPLERRWSEIFHSDEVLFMEPPDDRKEKTFSVQMTAPTGVKRGPQERRPTSRKVPVGAQGRKNRRRRRDDSDEEEEEAEDEDEEEETENDDDEEEEEEEVEEEEEDTDGDTPMIRVDTNEARPKPPKHRVESGVEGGSREALTQLLANDRGQAAAVQGRTIGKPSRYQEQDVTDLAQLIEREARQKEYIDFEALNQRLVTVGPKETDSKGKIRVMSVQVGSEVFAVGDCALMVYHEYFGVRKLEVNDDSVFHVCILGFDASFEKTCGDVFMWFNYLYPYEKAKKQKPTGKGKKKMWEDDRPGFKPCPQELVLDVVEFGHFGVNKTKIWDIREKARGNPDLRNTQMSTSFSVKRLIRKINVCKSPTEIPEGAEEWFVLRRVFDNETNVGVEEELEKQVLDVCVNYKLGQAGAAGQASSSAVPRTRRARTKKP
jgi:hypothetical protein